jgi:hypothetical protein
MTILIEASLPLLLLVRRTRSAGVLLGIGFHLLMAIAGFTPFSGLAMAMIFLFVPDDFPRRLQRCIESLPGSRAAIKQFAAGHSYVVGTLMLLWLLSLTSVSYGWIDTASLRSVIYGWFPKIFYLYAAGLGLLFVGSLCQGDWLCNTRSAFRFARPTYVAMPVLLVFNGLCPYLGLKTESSFTMYSNLQTEGDQWNHLLLSPAMRLFSYQDDLVQIIDSDHPTLAESAQEQRQWVPFEFRRFIAERPQTMVTYEFRGRVYEHHGETTSPLAFGSPSVALRKLFWFRQVAAADNNGLCH